ncbi:DNA damage-regulated autophagy modulator protein 1-like isoform X2 [Pyxicephalus adspersus]|uniref:DNA damage-regulated autophagy modulator protein 1-like isoform X2 n=1 Tax=Pyxicephalus adspersus TaxID=30357 RepID=UPI003B5CDBF1
MEVQGLDFLPVLWATWSFFGFITLYLLTILNGHAGSYFLYISETGDYFPESVLFMAVFLVSAVLDAFLSYCMYRYYAIKSSKIQHRYPHLQYMILGLGWIACLGTVIIAILPAVTYPVPHRSAATISFLGSAIHNTCQTILLYKLSFNSQHMCHLRMSISITTVFCLIVLFLSRLTWWKICSGNPCSSNLVCTWRCSFRENCLLLKDKRQEAQRYYYLDCWQEQSDYPLSI